MYLSLVLIYFNKTIKTHTQALTEVKNQTSKTCKNVET